MLIIILLLRLGRLVFYVAISLSWFWFVHQATFGHPGVFPPMISWHQEVGACNFIHLEIVNVY